MNPYCSVNSFLWCLSHIACVLSHPGLYDSQSGRTPRRIAEHTQTLITKPEPIPYEDLTEQQSEPFPQVEYPTNIMDLSKPHFFEQNSLGSNSKQFDRSISPTIITDQFKKKMRSIVKDSVNNVIANSVISKNMNPSSTSAARSGSSVPCSGFKAKQLQAIIKKASAKQDAPLETKSSTHASTIPTYFKSPKLARKLAELSRNKQNTTQFLQSLQTKNSSCTSLLTKEVPVLLLVDDAITVIENILNSTATFNASGQAPSISVKEAKRIISIVENISEILKIMECLNGMEADLYYSVKTGVSNKCNNKTSTRNSEEGKEDVQEKDTPCEHSASLPVIKVVDEAIDVVEDILNSTITLQNMGQQENKVDTLLSAHDAHEVVGVMETIKDILQILEQLNLNVNNSISKLKNVPSNSTQSESKIAVDATEENTLKPDSQIENGIEISNPSDLEKNSR